MPETKISLVEGFSRAGLEMPEIELRPGRFPNSNAAIFATLAGLSVGARTEADAIRCLLATLLPVEKPQPRFNENCFAQSAARRRAAESRREHEARLAALERDEAEHEIEEPDVKF